MDLPGLFLSRPLSPGFVSARGMGLGLFDGPQGPLAAVGWDGFRDMHFMADSFGSILLAILLGAVIAFHPTTPRTINHRHETEMRKVYIMYAFIGAVIGLTVREFGMVIGVVVFGIGGLIRFRTNTESTGDTGRLIAVTLSGLIAGLGLPHLAVITTLFTFVLIYLFDSNPSSRVRVDRLPAGRLAECAEVYRALLLDHGCKIIREHKSSPKGRVEFVFNMPRRGGAHDALHNAFTSVPEDVRGDIDWEVD